LEVIRLVQEDGLRPALVVGVPVGFVKAVESKDELLTLDVPYITAVGRKGGSTVAAATLNALLRLAKNS
jgi:precorrin-8X/cobalt-precorrin-8 methylmutase